MRNVNLLDARLLPREPVLRADIALAAFAALTLAVLGHGALEGHLAQKALAMAAAAQAGADAASAPGTAPGAGPATGAPAAAGSTAAGAAPGLPDLRSQLAQSEALLAALRGEKDMLQAPAATLRQVLAALPENMWLSEIDLAGARELRIAGGTLQPQALADFARRLGELRALQGLALHNLRLEALAAPAAAEGRPAPPAMHSFVLSSAAGTLGAADAAAGGGR